jgi:glycosyltransferase involved in cell wall biosynthesis
MPYESRPARIEPRTEPRRAPLRILFHVDHLGRGGVEASLFAWLRTLDRSLFTPALALTFPGDALVFWHAHGLPDDVPLHVLAPSKWMHAALGEAGRRRDASSAPKRLFHACVRRAIRPLVALRMRRLAHEHDVVCDFDLSLRTIAGSGRASWIGVSHFSLATALAGARPEAAARYAAQLARYDTLAVLGPGMLGEARQLMSGRAAHLVELPDVIDFDLLRARARVPLEARPAQTFIVSVARLDETQKDHATLLRAFALARTHGLSSADLVLIGEGPDQRALEQLAAGLGIRACVHFLGFCPNPFPYVRQAEMLVLSSRGEGSGIVLSEAMALGTPVIATDCPSGPRALLEDGKAGLLVPPGDVEALANAIERLHTDTLLRRALVQNAHRNVANHAPGPANERLYALAHAVRGAARAEPRIGAGPPPVARRRA